MILDRAIVWILVGLLLAGIGAYMRTAPFRLFTRPDDRAEYRPHAVELDSDQGRWLTRTYPVGLLAIGLILVAYNLFVLLSE